VASHGYGIDALNDEETALYNSIIIDPNTPVPVTCEKTYVTVEEGQTHIAIKMNEGEEEDLQYVKQIAKGDASFGRTVPKGYPMRVTIELTRAGIIELNSYDGETGAHLRKLVVKRESILSTDQQASARQELARWKVG